MLGLAHQIKKHIKNIFEEGELPRESTVAKFATVQNEAADRLKVFYRQVLEIYATSVEAMEQEREFTEKGWKLLLPTFKIQKNSQWIGFLK